MKKPVLSAVLSGTLLATVLVSPAAAQSSASLCNGLEPTIVGTEGDDVLNGTWRDDVIVGLGGDDQIRGLSGNDVICGGAGNDVIDGGSQDDIIFGGEGADVINGSSGEDELHGGGGDDVIQGGSQDDSVFGDAGNDKLYGESGADVMYGGAGDDDLFGNSQDDTMYGDAGDDMLDGGSDEDTLDGGTGNDVLDGSWQNDTCSNGEASESCENVLPGTPSEPVGPVLLSEPEMPWIQGSSEWVNLMWTTDVELPNVAVRVIEASDGLTVRYPSDGDRSPLAVDPGLSVSEMDFTAVHFTSSSAGALDATIEISWDDEDGGRSTSTFALSLSNAEYAGEDFAILTDAAVVGSDPEQPNANWIDLDYKGLSPTNTSMEMTVSGDLPVYHPQESFTSLHHDGVLHAGEADVARVWFDPERVEAGTFTLVVNISYVNSSGVASSVSHEVLLTVE